MSFSRLARLFPLRAASRYTATWELRITRAKWVLRTISIICSNWLILDLIHIQIISLSLKNLHKFTLKSQYFHAFRERRKLSLSAVACCCDKSVLSFFFSSPFCRIKTINNAWPSARLRPLDKRNGVKYWTRWKKKSWKLRGKRVYKLNNCSPLQSLREISHDYRIAFFLFRLSTLKVIVTINWIRFWS